MGLLDRMFAARSTAPPDPHKESGRSMLFGLPASGVRVDEDRSLNYSAVWSAVSMISKTMGIVSWQVNERQDGRRERLFDDPLARLLNVEPNPEMTPQTLKQTLAVNALLWGIGYAEIERNGSGRPVALWPIPSRLVTPKRTESGALVYEAEGEDGVKIPIPDRDMFAPIGISFDGVTPISPIQRARESVAMGIAMEQYGASFFGNDARPSFVLTAPEKLSDKAVENMRDWVKRNHGGPRNSWKPGILEQGTTIKEVGMPNDDAQFLESRKFQIGEIARWFNIPPHKIGDMERATFNNIDSRERMYVTEAVLPWARSFEEEANRKLVTPSRRGRIFTKFDLNSLMRGDVQTRGEFYNTLFNVGAFSPNDIRTLEDMNPVPGGNQRMVPGNMVPLTQAGSQMQPTTAMHTVFASSAERVLCKEEKAVNRTLDKEGLDAVERFYSRHQEEIVETFQAPVEALAAQLNMSMPTGLLKRWASEHCHAAVDRVTEADDPKAALAEWCGRSNDMASELIELIADAYTETEQGAQ